MLTFKKKIGESLLLFSGFVVFMNIFSLLITKSIDIEMVIIDILYILTFLWQTIRYINLKRRGKIQKQVRYVIEKTKTKYSQYSTLYAFIKTDNGMEYKVHHNKPINAFENIPNKGFVDVIVDSNNYKNYFILIETVKGK